jgi:hypothetical protein
MEWHRGFRILWPNPVWWRPHWVLPGPLCSVFLVRWNFMAQMAVSCRLFCRASSPCRGEGQARVALEANSLSVLCVIIDFPSLFSHHYAPCGQNHSNCIWVRDSSAEWLVLWVSMEFTLHYRKPTYLPGFNFSWGMKQEGWFGNHSAHANRCRGPERSSAGFVGNGIAVVQGLRKVVSPTFSEILYGCRSPEIPWLEASL